jgi:hypothetical protein
VQMPHFLGDVEALLLLDDVGLDRNELDVLLDIAPRCAFVIASDSRTLWGRGKTHPLPGLSAHAGLQLLERQVGRSFADAERASAERVVLGLDGHPQRLVEAAALIAEGTASLAELASSPSVVAERADPALLTDSQRRILEILGAIDGAALGTEHIAGISGSAGAEADLAALERRGWLKSESPRYRLVRRLSDGDPRDWLPALLGHLAEWVRGEAKPESVAQETEAIETAIERGMSIELYEKALSLAVGAEGKLAASGMLGSWRRVLSSGLAAAVASENRREEAYLLHQLGSRALVIGASDEARGHLGRSLQLREQLGNSKGAELTRHNLGEIEGGGANGRGGHGREPNGRGPGPRLPRAVFMLAALGALAAVGIVLLVSALGDDSEPDLPAKPTIEVLLPARHAQYDAGDRVRAKYSCDASPGAEPVRCKGTVPNGSSFDLTPGRHRFRVFARDSLGGTAKITVPYEVRKPPEDGETVIRIDRPLDGAQYDLNEEVLASFSCKSAPCRAAVDGTAVENGKPIFTSQAGVHIFTVFPEDGTKPKSVRYRVRDDGASGETGPSGPTTGTQDGVGSTSPDELR